MFWKKHKRRPQIDPKTEAVLALILDRVGELYKTQAVKLPYLVDVVGMEVLGRPVTSGTYKSWNHGVVATPVYDLITSARFGGEPLDATPFNIEELPGYEDRQVLKLDGSVPDLLDDDEREIVEFVAAQYGRLNSSALGLLTKEMNPHIKNWPSSQSVWVNAKAYGRLPVGYDEVDIDIARERMEEARRDPSLVVSGEELRKKLEELLG